VVVSHDRHLIKSVADTLWLVADGKLKVFDGDLDDYQEWLRSRGKLQQAAKPATGKSAGAAKKQRGGQPPGGARDPLRRLRRQLEQVEGRIAAIAAERLLVDAELAQDPQQDKLRSRRANLDRDAAYLEAQWMEIGIAIEAAEAPL